MGGENLYNKERKMERITRDNFDTEKVMELLRADSISHEEALRILEAATHIIARMRQSNRRLQGIIVDAMIASQKK